MNKHIKNQRGSAILTGIILVGILSASSVYYMQSNSNSTKKNAKQTNQDSVEVLNSLIKSQITYEISCKASFMDRVEGSAAAFISNEGGPIEVVLPDSNVAKAGANLPKFFTTINSLNLQNFKNHYTRFGYSFYIGQVTTQNTMSKSILKGNTQLPIKNISDLAVLIDKDGKFVTCSGSLAALEDDPGYILAKNDPNAKKDLQADTDKFKKLLETELGSPIAYTDLPATSEILPATSECDIVCQTVTAYYTRNISWYENKDISQLTKNFINSSAQNGASVANLVSSYNAVADILSSRGMGVSGLDKFMAPTGTSAADQANYIGVLDYYASASTNSNVAGMQLIENAVTEGFSAAQINDNYVAITSRYSSQEISDWFAAGYTIQDAINMGKI